MTFKKGENWFIRADNEKMLERLEQRDEVIRAARQTVELMPGELRESLKREFDRAEEEAERIRTHPGSRQ